MSQTKIRNVGPKSAAWLRQVGVRTHEDLVRIGAVEAFLKVKRAGFRPSLNLLYALAGALADCHWAELSEERKQELLAAADTAEAANPIRSRWDKAAARSARVDAEPASALAGVGGEPANARDHADGDDADRDADEPGDNADES